MTLKEKLTVITAGIVLVLCVLFGMTYIADGLGYGHFNLPVMVQALNVLKELLSIVGSMTL